MQCAPLSVVQDRIVLGIPLPFNVRNGDTTLLLAKGQVIDSPETLRKLCERGTLVDMAELLTTAEQVQHAKREELPRLWDLSLAQVSRALLHSPGEGFAQALDESTPAAMTLVDRDPELAIVQVLRKSKNSMVQTGINHSIHTAITAYLVAQRLGWDNTDMQRAFKVGLTMNLSVLELQGQLAQQDAPTEAQRKLIADHPLRSRQMLEQAGITDAEWLLAVEQHHETPDGKGYPKGITDISDVAALVQRADTYNSKISPRAGREALAADKAGRQMFMQEPGHPMTAALIKEFGVYPPGCFVKLMSGETGMVVQRGATVMTPKVLVMRSPNGTLLTVPVKRDTAESQYAVHSVVGGHADIERLTPEVMGDMLARE